MVRPTPPVGRDGLPNPGYRGALGSTIPDHTHNFMLDRGQTSCWFWHAMLLKTIVTSLLNDICRPSILHKPTNVVKPQTRKKERIITCFMLTRLDGIVGTTGFTLTPRRKGSGFVSIASGVLTGVDPYPRLTSLPCASCGQADIHWRRRFMTALIPFSSDPLASRLVTLIALWISLSIHEFTHASTARRLGDDTAEKIGRLTINQPA